VLESKYDTRTNLMRRPNFFSFDTPEDGDSSLRGKPLFCPRSGTRVVFDHLTLEMGWPGAGRAVKPANACQGYGVSGLSGS